MEWSSTPTVGPVGLSSSFSLTIGGEVKAWRVFLVSSRIFGPRVPNVVVSEVAEFIFKIDFFDPSTPFRTSSARWPSPSGGVFAPSQVSLSSSVVGVFFSVGISWCLLLWGVWSGDVGLWYLLVDCCPGRAVGDDTRQSVFCTFCGLMNLFVVPWR